MIVSTVASYALRQAECMHSFTKGFLSTLVLYFVPAIVIVVFRVILFGILVYGRGCSS